MDSGHFVTSLYRKLTKKCIEKTGERKDKIQEQNSSNNIKISFSDKILILLNP